MSLAWMKIRQLMGRRPDLMVIFGIIIFWILFYGVTQTVTSGFHLTDDHEIIELHDRISRSSQGVWSIASSYIHSDIFGTGRFRPFYYYVRFAEIVVFGPHSLIWSVWVAILAVLTSVLLYLFARRIGSNFLEAILFAGLVLIGRQAAIWWRLGPNETIGTVMLAASLLCLAFATLSQRYPRLFDAAFAFFAVLASLSKESYVLFLPALIYFSLVLHFRQSRQWKMAVRQSLVSLVVLSIVCVGELAYIKFFMHMGGLSYAGVDGFAPLRDFYIARVILSYNGFPLIVGAIVFFLVVLGVRNQTEMSHRAQSLWRGAGWLIVFLILVVVPQAVLYAKSGINADRYIIPSTVGLAIAILFLLIELRQSQSPYWAYLMTILLIGYLMIVSLETTMIKARSYTSEGQELRRTMQLLAKNTQPNDLIVAVSDPSVTPEWSSSLLTFVKEEAGRTNALMYPISEDEAQELIYRQNHQLICGQRCLPTNTSPVAVEGVIVFPDVASLFQSTALAWFKQSDFNCQTSGEQLQFTVCTRR